MYFDMYEQQLGLRTGGKHHPLHALVQCPNGTTDHPSNIWCDMIASNLRGATAQLTLTVVYLGGFVCGPLIFAPLSEFYGRSPILVTGFTLFTLATLGTALAPNWPAFLIFRFLTGVFGAPPISVGGGVIVSFDSWDSRNGPDTNCN